MDDLAEKIGDPPAGLPHGVDGDNAGGEKHPQEGHNNVAAEKRLGEDVLGAVERDREENEEEEHKHHDNDVAEVGCRFSTCSSRSWRA